MITTEVENFPGYPDGVEPFQMMDDLRRQAERFGTRFVSGSVTKVDLAAHPKIVVIEDTEIYTADTVIIATGASAKFLGIPSEQEYKGRGVSACATCDGFFYRKKTVAVVGGGDTACGEAEYLAGLCEKVYLIVRKPFLRASQIMQDRVLNNPKIEVLFEHNTLRLTGKIKCRELTWCTARANLTSRCIILLLTVSSSLSAISLQQTFFVVSWRWTKRGISSRADIAGSVIPTAMTGSLFPVSLRRATVPTPISVRRL